MKNLTHVSASSSGLLRRMVGVAATIALVSLVLMFSAVVFVVILVAGLLAWAYLWWKTRELRKQMRSFHAQGAVSEGEVVEDEIIRGDVIEGVSTRVDDPRDKY